MVTKPRTKKVPKSRLTRRAAVKAGFRSGFEQKFDTNIPKGCTYTYEEEKIKWEEHKVRTYTPDFVFTKKDGELMYVELKGKLDVRSRRVLKHVVQQHPDKDIRVLFQNAGNKKINKGSSTLYTQWCDKYNVVWYDLKGKDPQLPDEWLEELK